MRERMEAIVSGRVQMVMYRDFAQRKARGLGLTGMVRNLPDGTVRVVAEGAPSALDSYAAKLRKGPLLARVDRVKETRSEAAGTFEGFEIDYGG